MSGSGPRPPRGRTRTQAGSSCGRGFSWIGGEKDRVVCMSPRTNGSTKYDVHNFLAICNVVCNRRRTFELGRHPGGLNFRHRATFHHYGSGGSEGENLDQTKRRVHHSTLNHAEVRADDRPLLLPTYSSIIQSKNLSALKMNLESINWGGNTLIRYARRYSK